MFPAARTHRHVVRLTTLALLAAAGAACGASERDGEQRPAGARSASRNGGEATPRAAASAAGGAGAAAPALARGAPPEHQDGAPVAPDQNRFVPPATVPALGSASAPAPFPAAAVEATDDAGRRVRLARPARRVVSLVPGATETIVALGGAGQLVGRTRYDTAAVVRPLPSVGGGLGPSVESVLALRPDLVVTWASSNDRGFAAQLRAAGIATFALATRDTADVFRTAARLGLLLGRDSAARALNAGLRAELASVAADPANPTTRPTVLFVVWPDPPTTAGPATFITQLVGAAGGRTAFPDLTEDWPQISMEEVVRRQPDVVLLPVGEAGASAARRLASSPGWRGLRAVREGRIAEVDADLANRPGPNIARAARAIRDSLRAVLARHPL